VKLHLPARRQCPPAKVCHRCSQVYASSVKDQNFVSDHFTECIGDDLELGDIEYVLCVYEKDEGKIIASLEGQEKKPKQSQKYNPMM